MTLLKLFQTCSIGTMELRNRIIMPPVSTNFASEGFVTDTMKNYYAARAKGGVGMIIVEDAIIDSTLGRHTINDLHVDDDEFLPGLTQLANSIKEHGSRAVLHLNHAGRRAGRTRNGYLYLTDGRIPVAPSSLAWPSTGYVVPRELTIDEIEELIDKFAIAALRAKEAGFDGVGIHCTHDYLINQFLVPVSNKRNDEYGKDFEGRLKFLLRIIEKIQEKVGQNYPLLCRISGEEEPFEEGLTLEDMKKVAYRLEQAGIKALLLSRGSSFTPPTTSQFIGPVAPMRIPRGCMVYLTEGVKQAVKIPVVAVNRINDPVLAEQILEEGRADLIAMGRALVADPELPNKAKEGRIDEIRTCIACQQCIHSLLDLNSPVVCTINAQVGKEKLFNLNLVDKPEKVMVIGGGPAGMEAARVAAIRGHQVYLYESDSKLGGQLLLASRPPGKEEINSFTRYLEGECNRLGVKVKINASVAPEDIENLSPDVVIVASGSKPSCPPLPGMEKSHVVTAAEVLRGVKNVNGKVVVLGGGQVGVEVAEYLAVKGKDVTILEMLDQIASDMPTMCRSLLMVALKEEGVKIVTGAKAEEITDSHVVLSKRGKNLVIPADSVVLTLGAESDRSLEGKLGERPVLWVGDCVKPRKILEAVQEGFEAGAAV